MDKLLSQSILCKISCWSSSEIPSGICCNNMLQLICFGLDKVCLFWKAHHQPIWTYHAFWKLTLSFKFILVIVKMPNMMLWLLWCTWLLFSFDQSFSIGEVSFFYNTSVCTISIPQEKKRLVDTSCINRSFQAGRQSARKIAQGKQSMDVDSAVHVYARTSAQFNYNYWLKL